MADAVACYTNSQGENLSLFLDIDLGLQTIHDFWIKGSLAAHYLEEFKELESHVLGKTVNEALALKRSSLFIPKDTIAPIGLWLLHKAIDNYLGSQKVLAETKERLCLCFGITVSDIRKQILKSTDYDLKKLIAETNATSACGTCLSSIKKTMEELRLSHGMLPGLANSKERFDKNGNWIKVKGLYPGALVVMIDDLKRQWMEREAIQAEFSIEIIQIEGLHFTVKVEGLKKAIERERKLKILEAFSDFLKAETGILFFIHLL